MPTYKVLSPNGGKYRHLGSEENGLRSACGRIFRYSETLIENPGAIQVSCLVCQKTPMYKIAVGTDPRFNPKFGVTP